MLFIYIMAVQRHRNIYNFDYEPALPTIVEARDETLMQRKAEAKDLKKIEKVNRHSQEWQVCSIFRSCCSKIKEKDSETSQKVH
uniref:Uncharacterized protein n=1 Tax=Octopus bimaculoides TaxID=37653 RepID=A0A0L8GYX3_OCTBM